MFYFLWVNCVSFGFSMPYIWLGFGFLSFDSEEAIDKVVAEHYVNINGKQVIL